jgi:hypothetical protein
LARRHFRAFGPSTSSGFATWAGIDRQDAQETFEALDSELLELQEEASPFWILAESRALLAVTDDIPGTTRMLPPGDPYLLARDRALVVPDSVHRSRMWPQGNVPPGGVLVKGELVGTWRRQGHRFAISSWTTIHSEDREAIEAEVATMPPLGQSQHRVTWNPA